MSIELSSDWKSANNSDRHLDCYEELALAIVKQACKDYKAVVHRLLRKPEDEPALQMKADIEHFFRSGWFAILCELDGEVLMKRINDTEFLLCRGVF